MSTSVNQSLFEQGGRYSSIFIRFAGFSGASAVILGNLIYIFNWDLLCIYILFLGAYGAHKAWVKDPNKPNRDPKAIFETANR